MERASRSTVQLCGQLVVELEGRRVEHELPSRQGRILFASTVDVEEALSAVHRAESAVILGDWPRGWSAALCAQFIAGRPLLEGTDLPWLDAWRRRLDDALERALEAYGAACLGAGPARG